MSRKKKNTVDYFPHLIRGGKTMFIIESKYKNDGYATWFKILERLGTSENHFIDLSDNKELMYLASTCNIDENLLNSIINDLVDLGKFDKDLWKQNIIWSQDFVDNISPLYERRGADLPTKELICKHLSLKREHNSSNDNKSTHSRVEYSIEEESKGEKSRVEDSKKKEKKTELHSQFVKIYFDWYKEKFDLEPPFDGSDGKAIYSIITFLKKNVKKDQDGGDFLLNSWKFVLEKHSSWDKFYQKKRRIREISSNLSNIITDLKNETGAYTTSDGFKVNKEFFRKLFEDS